MNKNTEKAKKCLQNGTFTCVFVKNEKEYASAERGVKPLLRYLDEGTDLCGFSAADKVVGKAAAFLYVLLGVEEVYATVISTPSITVLKEYGIRVFYDREVDTIRNRTDTGSCPMEEATRGIDEPVAALAAIKSTLEKLRKQ